MANGGYGTSGKSGSKGKKPSSPGSKGRSTAMGKATNPTAKKNISKK